MRDEWNSWVVEDQLLVLWDRWHHPSNRRRAFRVAVCEWEQAWEEARRRVEELWEQGLSGDVSL